MVQAHYGRILFVRIISYSKAHAYDRQGDREKLLGLPISPLCNRVLDGNTVANAQIGFFNFIVLPIFNAADLTMSIAGFSNILQAVHQNATRWKEIAEATTEKDQRVISATQDN